MLNSQISLDRICVLQVSIFAFATFGSTRVLLVGHGSVAQGPIVMVRKVLRAHGAYPGSTAE